MVATVPVFEPEMATTKQTTACVQLASAASGMASAATAQCHMAGVSYFIIVHYVWHRIRM